MRLIIKPTKLAIILGILSLIMIGVYGLLKNDSAQGVPTSQQATDQPQTMSKDPFKEYLEKQQQGAAIQTNPDQTSQPIRIGDGTSTTTVPVGTDPFKAFLEAQSKAKPEEAGISPFSSRK
jgi:hypothetical protein